MTEGYEDGNKGSFLVRVRAQVMKRDDSTGGWLPMGEGGLSSVSVHKCSSHCSSDDNNKHEYLISGRRISDQSEVFRCLIKKDFEYNKVMPTFHHWRTGDKKFGLTFQTAADARAFDKGVRLALMQVALCCNGPIEDKSQVPPMLQTGQNIPQAGLSGPTQQSYEDTGDDEVFMTLELPMERGDSQSSSDSSGIRQVRQVRQVRQGSSQPLQTLAPKRSAQSPEGPRAKDPPPGGGMGTGMGTGTQPPLMKLSPSADYSYVQLTSVHEYIYPVVEDCRDSLKKRSLDTPLAVSPAAQPQPPLPSKKKERQLVCRHCQEAYSVEKNPRGGCEFAPDCIRSAVDTVTCISCAQCMLYHCMADSEGDFVQRPCDCSTMEERCGRRWLGLTLLSILVPCLLLYPPLRACHWCGVTCGLCGSRHEPS